MGLLGIINSRTLPHSQHKLFTSVLKNDSGCDVTVSATKLGQPIFARHRFNGSSFMIAKGGTKTIEGLVCRSRKANYEFMFDDHEYNRTLSVVWVNPHSLPLLALWWILKCKSWQGCMTIDQLVLAWTWSWYQLQQIALRDPQVDEQGSYFHLSIWSGNWDLRIWDLSCHRFCQGFRAIALHCKIW